MLFFILILLVINIEAVTNILSKSDLFKPVRKFLFNRSNNRGARFLHDLLDCSYCTSIWVSLVYVTIFYIVEIYVLSSAFMFVMLVIALHRISNLLHHIIDRVDKNSGYDMILDKENDI